MDSSPATSRSHDRRFPRDCARSLNTGLLERVRYAQDPDRYEYPLTEAGRDLFPRS